MDGGEKMQESQNVERLTQEIFSLQQTVSGLQRTIRGLQRENAQLRGVPAKMVSSRRHFLALRSETAQFLTLVRQLNGQAVNGDSRSLAATKQAMLNSVGWMTSVAGISARK
jgi:predicted RNase H-like nuclease (RuvC/YqgF family)